MRASDLAAVREIEALSFSNPWPDSTFLGEVQNKGISFPMVIVGPEDGRVVGYVMYWLIRDEVQINNFAVHPEFRGRGLGEAALRLVLSEVREKGAALATLEVRVSNAAALGLYEKLGFKELGTRKAYYTNPVEDAYVMGLVLGP
jgi:[ribosomal protein S18]-alanine N-acetyltransferase